MCLATLILAASSRDLFELVKTIAAGAGVVLAPVCLFLLTRRANAKEDARRQATQVEQLYIGEAGKLIATLQEELRIRTARVNTLETEREQLKTALTEERQMFEILRQRQRDTLTLLENAGVNVPSDLHL